MNSFQSASKVSWVHSSETDSCFFSLKPYISPSAISIGSGRRLNWTDFGFFFLLVAAVPIFSPPPRKGKRGMGEAAMDLYLRLVASVVGGHQSGRGVLPNEVTSLFLMQVDLL